MMGMRYHWSPCWPRSTQASEKALISILKMAAKVKQSEYDEKEQVWLLLSELAETAKGAVDAAPLPSPIVAFARHALEVLKNPLHPLYEKVNVFLTRGPIWSLDKVPLVHEILLEGAVSRRLILFRDQLDATLSCQQPEERG